MHEKHKASVYFASSSQSSAGAILPFEPYPALSTYNTEFVRSSMNLW